MNLISKSVVVASLLVSSASAASFTVLGTKAASMGGAGVATSPTSLATYNNPALLAKNKQLISFHTGIGLGLNDDGVAKGISDLDSLDFSDLVDKAENNIASLTNNDIRKLYEAKDTIMGLNNSNVAINANADVAFAIKNYGIGVFVNGDFGAIAEVDQTRDRLIFENHGQYFELNSNGGYSSSNKNSYENSSIIYAIDQEDAGDTGVYINGIAIAEVPFGYGHELNLDFGDLYIGGALKVMKGKTYSNFFRLDSDDDLGDVLDKNAKDSTSFGVDLGVAFNPIFSKNLTLALVGKNLNSPKFDIHDGDKYKLKPMIRAGAAYNLGLVEFAIDADLTENESIIGRKTRYIGGGASINALALCLNAGLMKNIASSDDSGLIYTAGISAGPLELSGQMSSKTTQFDGTKYPKYANVNLSLSFSW